MKEKIREIMIKTSRETDREETWIEQIPGELFIIRSPEGIPFEGDDGRAYEILIKKESDGSISTLVVDLETGVADPVRLRDYAEEARRRWSDETRD